MDEQAQPAQADVAADGRLAGAADRFVDRLAERLGGQANAAVVYGTPVEREGVTVIPVAKVRWGFRGGVGRGAARATDGGPESSGAGGGGGVIASPLGYIELAGGRATFRRIADASALLPIVPLVLASGVSTFLILSGLARLWRVAARSDRPARHRINERRR